MRLRSAGLHSPAAKAFGRWLVADGEALALELGTLQFVDEGDGVVFHRDAAVVLVVGDEVVFAEAEFSGALAGLKECSGAEAGPVDVGLFDEFESVGVGGGDGEPLGREMTAGEEGDSGSNEEAGGATDVDEAGGFGGLADGIDEVLGDGDDLANAFGGEGWGVGADYGVEGSTCYGQGDGSGRVSSSLLDGEVGLRGEFGGVADDGGDVVAAGEEFGEDAAAGLSGGSVEGDVHWAAPNGLNLY